MKRRRKIMSLKDLMHKYENTGGSFKKMQWFSLKDDGDTAVVRFNVKGKTTDDEYDFDVYEVHEAEIDGFKKKIKCLGNDCPMCEAGQRPSLKVWIPLFNKSESDPEKQEQVWERGLTEIKKLMSLCEEYGDLDARDFKVKRSGKKGSTKTAYEFFPKDKVAMALPDRPKVLGRYVLELTAAQMEDVLDGEFSLKGSEDENPF
jgi:hypothetical protein